jgi:hypothetical protein
MDHWESIESFEFEGKLHQVKRKREIERNVYAVFRDDRRANGYTYSAHDLDLVPTDSELIAIAKSDVEHKVWERNLQALRELHGEQH